MDVQQNKRRRLNGASFSSTTDIVTSSASSSKIENLPSEAVDVTTERNIGSDEDIQTQQAMPPPRIYQASIARDNGNVHNGDVLGDVTHHHHYNTKSGHENALDENDERFLKLKESLRFSGMGARIDNIAAAMSQTCLWLIVHHQFQKWIERDHPFLWIKGKPGCGKSTLMKTAHDHIVKQYGKQRSWTILSYFFNARAKGELEKSALGVYRSLVHDMLEDLPQVRSSFAQRFKRKAVGDDIDAWTITELQNFLFDIIEELPEPLCIFIDALDEGQVHDVQRMVNFCDDFLARAQAVNYELRICFSSRHYPQISIPHSACLTVEQEPAHDEDIQLYISTKLATSTKPGMTELANKLYARSTSVFLWVVLVVAILNEKKSQGTTMTELELSLEELPDDLDGLFARILQTDGDNLTETVVMFQWMLFASTQLTLSELLLAVHCSCEHGKIDFSSNYLCEIGLHTFAERRLTQISRGLLEVTKSKARTVQFIHETVRFYLTSDNGLPKLQPSLRANLIGESHALLRETCSWYLDGLEPETLHSKPRDPSTIAITVQDIASGFRRYSVAHLYKHADMAQSHSACPHLFLIKRSELGLWTDHTFIKHHDTLEKFEVRKFSRHGKQIPLLNALVHQNLPSLTALALSQGADVNAPGGRYGTALQAACVNGDYATVVLLLKRGAAPNSIGGTHGNALIAALLGSHLKIARMLHDSGARLTEEQMKRLAVTLISRGKADTLEFMSLHNSLHLSSSVRWESLMSHAVRKKKPEIVKLILESGGLAEEPGLIIKAIGIAEPTIMAPILKACNSIHPDLIDSEILLDLAQAGKDQMLSLIFEHGVCLEDMSEQNRQKILSGALRSQSIQTVHAVVQFIKNHKKISPELGVWLVSHEVACCSGEMVEVLLDLVPCMRKSSCPSECLYQRHVPRCLQSGLLHHWVIPRKDKTLLMRILSDVQEDSILIVLEDIVDDVWVSLTLREIFGNNHIVCLNVIATICYCRSMVWGLKVLGLALDSVLEHGLHDALSYICLNLLGFDYKLGHYHPAQACLIGFVMTHNPQSLQSHVEDMFVTAASIEQPQVISHLCQDLSASRQLNPGIADKGLYFATNLGNWENFEVLVQFQREVDETYIPENFSDIMNMIFYAPPQSLSARERQNLSILEEFHDHYRRTSLDDDFHHHADRMVVCWKLLLYFWRQPDDLQWAELRMRHEDPRMGIPQQILHAAGITARVDSIVAESSVVMGE